MPPPAARALRSAAALPLTIGNKPGARRLRRGPRLAHARLGRLDRLIGDVDAPLQRVEIRIAEQFPPAAARCVVARLRVFPVLAFLEGRRNRRGGAHVVGSHHAAGQEHGDHRQTGEDASSRFQSRVFASGPRAPQRPPGRPKGAERPLGGGEHQAEGRRTAEGWSRVAGCGFAAHSELRGRFHPNRRPNGRARRARADCGRESPTSGSGRGTGTRRASCTA